MRERYLSVRGDIVVHSPLARHLWVIAAARDERMEGGRSGEVIFIAAVIGRRMGYIHGQDRGLGCYGMIGDKSPSTRIPL